MGLSDALVFLDSHQEIQGAINTLCMVATGALVLAPLVKKRIVPRLSFLLRPWLFLALIAVSLFACRYPAFFYPRYMDPDEAQMLAQAITFETHPVPWRDADGTTSGPVNSYALLWCLPFGAQPNYATGRVLELSCLMGMFIFLYWAGRRIAGDLAARLSLMPAFLFVCWTTDHEFVHCSTEEVPLFFLAWALFLLTELRQGSGKLPVIVLLGIVLGLLPFAKLQSVLPGGFLGFSAIWFIFNSSHGDRRAGLLQILVLMASALVPALLILGTVAYAGAFGDFWQSYIRMAQTYGVQYPSRWAEIKAQAGNLAWIITPGSPLAIPVYLTGLTTLVLAVDLVCGSQKAGHGIRHWFLWAVLFGLVTIATISFTGEHFLHYHFFLLLPLTFLLAVNFRLLHVSRQALVASPAMSRLLPGILLSLLLVFARLPYERWHDVMTTFVSPGLVRIALMAIVAWPIAQALLKTPPFPSLFPSQKFVPWVCLTLFFVLPAVLLSGSPNEFRGNIKLYLAEPLTAMDQAILRERPPGGRLAIWGWGPEFAAETRTPLGTRDSICQFMIRSSPLQDYYRQRYLRDLQVNRPELFLEATGPGNFIYSNRKAFGIETFPELAKLVADQYRLSQEIDGMRLFVRRDLPNTDPGEHQETQP